MAAAATAQGVRPKVPAPDTYDGKPASLRGWLFSVELYFKACRLDFLGTDQDYCGALALSLLRGNALLWLRWHLDQGHAASLTKYADVRKELLGHFKVVDEIRNARDRLKTLTQTKGV